LQPHAIFSSSFIKDGKIVPVEVTVSLLSKAIFSSPSWNFLVDGFPRNMDNFNGWFDAIGDECDVRLSSSSAVLHRPTPFPCRSPSRCISRALKASWSSG
jgi:hypothetical protein